MDFEQPGITKIQRGSLNFNPYDFFDCKFFFERGKKTVGDFENLNVKKRKEDKLRRFESKDLGSLTS